MNYGYDLDVSAAKNAESIGKYIRETGKYIGKFIRAEVIISKEKGSRGIEFDFVADNKECTLQIWTHSSSGEPFAGNNMINAIMTCLKLRGIRPTMQRVDKYDYDIKQKTVVEANVFPDLMHKPIGLLLQKEISEYQGKEKSKMLIFAAFDAQTEQTASEIIDKIPQPLALGRMVANLADKDTRKHTASHNQQYASYRGGNQPIDDDLPFN